MSTRIVSVILLSILAASTVPAFSAEVTLESLTCVDQHESVGDDEIFIEILVNGNRHNKDFIKNMKRGDTFTLNEKITFEKSLKVVVWDRDPVNRKQLLGEKEITVAGPGEATLAGAINGLAHEYKLKWK